MRTPVQVIDAALEAGSSGRWVIEQLAEAGFVIVPRKATAAMSMVHPFLPCRDLWDLMIKEATKP